MRRPALATLTVLGFGLAIGGAVPAAALAQAQVRYPTRPGERELVSDGASLLTPEDRAKVVGTDRGTGKHERSQEIVDERIVPRFKQGDFSGGIAAGVEGLAAMACDIAWEASSP